MITKEYDILLREALTLVTRYFDGDTSLAEEKRLRSLLADPALESEELDDARAVMGFVLFDKAGNAAHTQGRGWLRVAAGVAAVVSAAISFVLIPGGRAAGSFTDQQCVAYVGGRKVTDRDAVLAMVDRDLSEFSDAFTEVSEQIDCQLSEFALFADENDLKM